MATHDNNWVKINRSIFDNFLWQSEEPFDVRSAWIDLILLANHEDGYFRTSRGETIKIPRGSHFTSVRKLAARWHWSTGKVQRYLDTLTDTQMITQCGTQSGTLLSLIKYDDFQGVRYTDGYTDRYTDGYTDGRRTRIIKKNKEGEKNNPSPFPDFEEVKTDDESRSTGSVFHDGKELDISETVRNRTADLRGLVLGIAGLSDRRSPSGDSECD